MNTCNNTIDKSTDCSKFIFFGCWNNINCDNEYIYRNIVLDYLYKNEQDIKQIYLAGDNWYTNKKTIGDKVFKLYLTDVLRTGYEKLYAMNKDIYIAIGNHDIDSNIKSRASGASGASCPRGKNRRDSRGRPAAEATQTAAGRLRCAAHSSASARFHHRRPPFEGCNVL
jgi:hypothetical protein